MSSKRFTLLILAIIAATVAIILAIVFVGRNNTSPTPAAAPTSSVQPAATTEPTPEPSLTRITPNFASIEDGTRKSMFDGKLTVIIPQSWDQTMSDPDVAWNYVDRSTCNASNADCPSVHFSNLTTTSSPDLLKEWMDTPCEHGDKNGAGPLNYTLSNESVEFYAVKCPKDETTRYAWFVSSKDVLVTTYAGREGGLSSEIVQAVLEKAKWRR